MYISLHAAVRRHPSSHQRQRYGQARPSALLLRLVARVTAWLNAWYERRLADFQRWQQARRAEHAAPRRMQFEALEPRLLMSADLNAGAQAPNAVSAVDVHTVQPASDALAVNLAPVNDADGTQGVISIVGLGTAQLVAQGDAYLLQLSGTDANTQITLTATGGDGRIKLAGISADADVGTLALAAADLSGDARFAGKLGLLTLGQVDHATLSLAGSGGAALRLGEVTDSQIEAPAAHLSLTAFSIAASSPGSAAIEAAALTSLHVSGDMSADITISGLGVTGRVLDDIKVEGHVTGGLWVVNGRANNIDLGSTAAAWRLNVGNLERFTTLFNASGHLAATRLQELHIGGSAIGLSVLIGADLGDDATLGGNGADADSFGPGTLAHAFITGDMVDSSILVSVDPVNGVFGDGDDLQLGTPVQRLQEIVVGGALTGETSVVAPVFPVTVSIGGQTLAPSAVPNFAFNTPGSAAPDTTAPVVSMRLRNDSGSSATDGLTRDASLRVDVTEANALGAFQARLSSSAAFTTIIPLRQPDGSYLVIPAQLATLNGGSLPDRAYTVELRVSDEFGNVSRSASTGFTLDTAAPAASAFGLDPASDTGALGDLSTTAGLVKMVGLAEAGVAVSLRRSGSSTEEAHATVAANGAFAFDGIALPLLGANPFALVLTDSAGNSQALDYIFTREAIPGGDSEAPTVSATLVSDTGSTGDNVTRDPSIRGNVADNLAVVRLQVALDPGSVAVFTDITASLQPDGSFVLGAAQLASIAGGTLAEGAHSVRVVALDAAGNAASATVAFTLDTVAPAASSFAITGADAVDGDTSKTSAAIVMLRGLAEAGATVTLAAQGLSAAASQTGAFQLPGVALAMGDNVLTLSIVDQAGNTADVSRTLTRVAPVPGQLDPVLEWNQIALAAIQRDVTDVPIATRILAIQSLAVYDTLAAIEGTPAFMVQDGNGAGASVNAALAQAAYRVLWAFYPGQRSTFEAALAADLAKVAEGAAKTAGIALGERIANAVTAIRANDGYLDFETEAGSTELGKWRPTEPMYLVADNPQWAGVAPFVLSAPDEFRAPPPPSLDSAEYAAAEEEVRLIGSASSTVRTADQTQQAHFWADGAGSVTPPGHWNQIAEQVAAAQGNSLSANARLMAQLNVALADAAIACWDTKYTYDFWRPETAINNGELDNNPATQGDESWRPLLINPPHPDYISGHSTFSAAAASILAATFGDDTAFSTTSSTLPGVTRSFTSFTQAADEAGYSRVYGGIHTSLANNGGAQVGGQVASAVLERFALTTDLQAPTVIAADSAAVLNTNLTLTGQVLDNLSGVASAQYRLDSGDLQTLSLAADGSFAITTPFALDGSADGAHTLTVLARDAAGNLNAGYTRAFSLDTLAPTLALTTLPDGTLLDTSSRLTGTAGATGSSIVTLNYSVDGAAAKSISFDATTGSFDQSLALGNLGIGAHSLSVTTTDAAGNTSTVTRAVTLDQLPAFGVTKVTPSSGSSDVGSTYRPQVYFSRAVNPATLTNDSFYATGPDGARLATTIVPALDGSFAWLFFNQPMPGSSTVTLHVNGSAIRAAQDGAFLDGDNDGSAGGELSWNFTTVSTTSVLGARLVGKVVDPGPDLLPMSFDDIRRGPDGVIHTPDDVFLNPIAHVKVYIVGQENQFTYTDAQGNFAFESVPVGNVKVAIDGRTATNPPAGVFFPEMVMDVTLKPGTTNTLMGSMGSTESQASNADRTEVYLPRVQSSSLQAVSDTSATTITVDAASAPALTDAQRAELTMTIQPGSAIGFDGLPVEDVQIGMNTVPPELVKDMLPPGVLQHTFDITIQAPGVDTFAAPVQITFPNVFNAAPGTKLNILSFDHTTGRLVINGTGTVSTDGLTVVSDEGSGVMAPGWHGLTPPGDDVNGPPPMEPPPDKSWEEITKAINGEYQSLKGSASEVLAAQVDCIAMVACENADTWATGWVKNVFNGLAEDAQNRLDGDIRFNALGIFSGYPYLGTAIDYSGDYIPNVPLEIGGVTIIRTGDLIGLEQGVGRHFVFELLPYFVQNADHLHDTDANGDLLHDKFFNDAVVPCFEHLAEEGIMSPGAAWIAQKVVPALAATMRETIYWSNRGVDSVVDFVDDLLPDFNSELNLSRTSAAEAVDLDPDGPMQLQLAASSLFDIELSQAGNIAITTDKFFVKVGETIDLNVSLRNADGTLFQLDPAEGVSYFPVADPNTVSITSDGKLTVLATDSPLAAIPSVLYVVVQQGENTGVAQLAITDSDSNGNLFSDSYERHFTDLKIPQTAGDSLSLLAASRGVENIISEPLLYAVENLENGIVLRGQTSNDGSIDGLFLAASSSYRVSYLDIGNLFVGSTSFLTGSSGSSSTIPAPAILSPTVNAIDTDAEGLADIAEFVVGTSGTNGDTDLDGISDLSEVQQGLDPLGGFATTTGIQSIADIGSSANAISIGTDANTQRTFAYVATEGGGLSIVDISRPAKPVLSSSIPLLGASLDVAIDAERKIAVVAAGTTGLHIVDVGDVMVPTVSETVTFRDYVASVEIRDGIAYIATGGSIAAVDLNTGEVRQTLDLSGTSITSLAIEGPILYAIDSSLNLRSVAIADDQLVLQDSLSISGIGSNGKLFVGGGVVYVGGDDGFQAGFVTVDASNPANLHLLSGADDRAIAGGAIALNGSGLGVVVGSPGGAFGANVIDVVDTTDPSDTGNLVTRYTLPAPPRDVALANGLAFVADGTGGLQIVNYIGFDALGVPPTVSISVDAIDADPNTEGVQILEGRSVQIKPTVTDDVQVRNVELLVNGQVVSNDAAFPFELFTRAPTIASGGTTLTLQVRATDTGGNATLSDPVVLTVVPDTFAPVVQTVSVAEDARLFFVRSINIAFDEPLDLSLLDPAGVSLVRAGADGVFGTSDDQAQAVTLDNRSQGQQISILPTGYLAPGDYELTVGTSIIADAAGNVLEAPIVRHFTIRAASDIKAGSGAAEISTAPSANPGQQIGVAVPFDPATARAEFATIDSSGNVGSVTYAAVRWDAERSVAYFNVPLAAVTGDMVVYSQVGATRTDFDDGSFPLQIVPVVTGVQVSSVAYDGSTATLLLTGRGFVEGNSSEYRFGSGADGQVVIDADAGSGPDVQWVYDYGLGQYGNGQVYVTVPLVDGAFGAISVKTGGGVSAGFTSGLTGVTALALSGTPADAAQASANPGQAVTLQGTGLSAATDVLMRYTDYNGTVRVYQVSPTAVSSDGTEATLLVPTDANGVFSLQVFGSTAQPLLQIVPTLQRLDGDGRLGGAGLVEGGTRYDLPGIGLDDTAIDSGVDVSYTYYYDYVLGNYVYSEVAYLYDGVLPHHGAGTMTATTAGGTSAPLTLQSLRPGSDEASLGPLSDLAIDAATGALWVVDYVNPGSVLKVDPASGAVLQTIALDTDTTGNQYVGNYAGLQVAPADLQIGGTDVPAGSLLLFSGYYYDSDTALVAFDPSSGAVLAKLSFEENYYGTGGLYDPASGHLFVLSGQADRMIEIDPADGSEVARFELPLSVQSWSGMAIDPADGNFWMGSSQGGSQLVKIDREGAELARVDLSQQGFAGSVTGVALAADGTLRVSSTDGQIYLATTTSDAATRAPTLTQVVGAALSGVAAQAGVAAANVGQVIELLGSNFNGGTQVLFNTRDNAGNLAVVAVRPTLVDSTGTRLQVVVPLLATTGDVRVSNLPTTDLGFSSYADSIHRGLTATFVARSDTAVLRFADAGLEDLNNESWGLDNVRVTQGGTLVFEDAFQGGARSEWSDSRTNNDSPAIFSQFSGRFNNEGQTLNLSGLVAGQTYTLSFDLYAIDSWDGDNATGADADRIVVTADDTTIFDRSVASYPGTVQTLDNSAGLRLQIVPTLAALSGQPGQDEVFYLQGSGFMEGASSIRIGGVVLADTELANSPFDVYGGANDNYSVFASRTLDGPVRITTEGGYAELPGTPVAPANFLQFSGITASINIANGVPTDAALPSAATGQTIVLTGQGFTSETQVQFLGIDDTGTLGTITRTGSAGNNGTTLSVVVPALARSGAVLVLGSGTSIDLQVVPTLRSVGGTVAAGNTLLLEGTGLTANDLMIQIDGRGVGSFTVRTLNDGLGGSPDQQLIELTVPAGVGAGVITVSTAGGMSTLRSGGVAVTPLADLSPADDVGDTLATALVTGLAVNQSVQVVSGIGSVLDVDLQRVELTAGEELRLNVVASDLYGYLRIFDAAGQQVFFSGDYFNPGTDNNQPVGWTAPATGSYFIGVSGYNNTSYDPTVAGSGANGSYTGSYTLDLERRAAGSGRLSGIATTAASGTPTAAGVASANTLQTLTLNGVGLLASDRVVFTMVSDYDGRLYDGVVTPTSVAEDGQSLSVVVPQGATTGTVRLQRDVRGVLLQVVPTLTDLVGVQGGVFSRGQLTVSGSGFAEGAVAVLFGERRVDDLGRYYGTEVSGSGTQLSVTVPAGAATGPIRISTVGGTSATFGMALGGVSATPGSGSAGNGAVAAANPGQAITLTGVGFDTTMNVVFETIDYTGNRSERIVRPATVSDDGTQAQVIVPVNAITGSVRLVGDANGAVLPLQIVPLVSGVQLQSVAADGSSAVVVLSGQGFVEGNGSEYRFGDGDDAWVVVDRGVGTGPDVQLGYDYNLGQYVYNQVVLTVPLVNGAFGAISVKTAGGSSAGYTLNLSSIASVALSGTPANAALASANAGQSVTLLGTGLTATTDVLLSYTDDNGNPAAVSLSPTAVSADGTQATLLIPTYANGVFGLRVFGAAQQPLLQIVPTLDHMDGNGQLFGAGLVEGGTTYSLPGNTIADGEVAAGINVYYTYYYDYQQGNYVYSHVAGLDASVVPHHGLGATSVTTAGGTSASFLLGYLRPGSDSAAVGALSDVAVDPATGAIWVVDTVNPGHLLRLDPGSGEVVQTISLSADPDISQYTGNYAGLQVLPSAMSLGGTAVPAGSLLLFSGYPYNAEADMVAFDPSTGNVIATLATATEYYATAGVFDAASGHLFVLSESQDRLVELSPSDGSEIARFALPFEVYNWAGLAIDPSDGNFWMGSSAGGAQLVKIDREGQELARVDLVQQGFIGSISGLAFAPGGSLRVSSTNGQIFQAAVGIDPATLMPTLTQVVGTALSGVAAQAGVAAANVGQVIELVGTNFGPGTQVYFPTRDNAGAVSVIAVEPLLVDSSGTRLQVVVPPLATSGDVSVNNLATADLGFASYADALHRGLTASFVAGSGSVVLNFAGSGLESLDNESWGLDNVRVTRGTTLVFNDDFEGGARAEWGDSRTNDEVPAIFSQFSGRFGNEGQTLALTGLTAGQTYTVSFDLYALDSLDGVRLNGQAADRFTVSADGGEIFNETLGNYIGAVASLGQSAGVRLQIVPTLSGLTGSPGIDGIVTLQGSGFMEGASTLTVGGVAQVDSDRGNSPLDVYGAANSSYTLLTSRTLDGPIRITTEGGYAELPGAPIAVQPLTRFSGIVAGVNVANGVPADAGKASAGTGQTIVLTGQGFSNSTQVQFLGIDDSGQLGTLTRTGSPSSDGTSLSVVVPTLARSGAVTVLGSGSSIELQVVPTLRSVGGTVAAGQSLLLEGTGLTINDLVVLIDGIVVSGFSVRTLNDGGSSGTFDQQLLQLTVPAGVGAGLVTVSTAGGSSSLRSAATNAAVLTPLNPSDDVGDTLATALQTGLSPDQSVRVVSAIASGPDVDLQQVDLAAGEELGLNVVSSGLYGHLRIFDAAGQQVFISADYFGPGSGNTPSHWTAAATGSYYVGVSGYANTTYDPTVAGSGQDGGYSGSYTLEIERRSAGSGHLSGIAATASSGTPATAGVASANTLQTITLNGIGLLSTDRVMFTVVNDGDGRLYETVVVPSSVASDGASLSVVVPQGATTGSVRLQRDVRGILLQVVPTLSDLRMDSSGVSGGQMTLVGSGFAEANVAVLFGSQRLDDLGRYYGTEVYGSGTGMYVRVPEGAVSGPIRVSSVGGTSAAFGLALSGLSATAGSGTPADGGLASANPGQTVTLSGVGFDTSTDVVFDIVDTSGQLGQLVVRPSSVNGDGSELQVAVPQNAVTGIVRVMGDLNGAALALQIVPLVSGVEVLSVASDGLSAVVIVSGRGFVEGRGNSYRFGDWVVLDDGIDTGPDVVQAYDYNLGQYVSQVVLTVPLVEGAFGAITVSTAGGSSASFSTSLTTIDAVALSGTPTNAGLASANPGQTITLHGSGFAPGTDVLLRYVGYDGQPGVVVLNPASVSEDGSEATLLIPTYANGAFALSIFGASGRPLLQIVPVVQRFNGNDLEGAGFVEGATSYNLPGNPVEDDAVDEGVDVSYYYDTTIGNYVFSGRADLSGGVISHYGFGEISVTTAGGTSAPLLLDTLRPGSDSAAVGQLSDVAVDAATGAMWTMDTTSPGHLLQIDPVSGEVLQTITLETDAGGNQYTANYAGLQIVPAAMSLGGTAVPAGSLLAFTGLPYQSDVAVVAYDPATGAVLARLSFEENYYATSGLYDPTSGHLFVLSTQTGQMVELNPDDGTEVARFDLPLEVGSWSGMAIDPDDGNFWIGSDALGAQVVKVNREGEELARVDLADQGIEGDVSGLAFASDGSLRVSSSNGLVYRATLA